MDDENMKSKPLPKSPFHAAPPEDPAELAQIYKSRRRVAELLKEPTASELPVLLEKHASLLAELRHYDIAADVQLASERLANPVLVTVRKLLYDVDGRADHMTHCDRTMGATHPCTCGANEARRLLAESSEGEV